MAAHNSNPYEALGRDTKAAVIADLLGAYGYSSATVAGFSLDEWLLAYAGARQIWRDNPETRDLVIKKLHLREVALRTAQAIIRDAEAGV